MDIFSKGQCMHNQQGIFQQLHIQPGLSLASTLCR